VVLSLRDWLILLSCWDCKLNIPCHLIRKGIVLLDPTMPPRGRVDHKLKLLINVELEE